MTDLVYLGTGFAGLAVLCIVLIVIGRAAASCPEIGAAARVSTLVVVTGFCAVGTGVIALIGAALPYLASARGDGLYLATGCLAIALGIGFYNAASTLRDLLAAARSAVGRGAAPA